MTVFFGDVEMAEKVGAVTLAYGNGRRRDELKHVRLISPEKLYEHLGRDRATSVAADALQRVLDGSTFTPPLAAVVHDITKGWAAASTLVQSRSSRLA